MKKISAKRINFHKSVLEALPPLQKRYEVSDIKVHALRLFVYPSGQKTFFLYRKVKGRPQRIKIGNYSLLTIEQARNKAKQLNSLIELGNDPFEEIKARRKEPTFKELFELYYNEYLVLHTKRPNDNRKILEFHVLPKIGNKKISEISTDSIRAIHRNIGENRGRQIANRVINIVSPVFNFSKRHKGYNGINPCIGLTRFTGSSRDRFLNREELDTFFKAVEKETVQFQDLFMLLLYTGARKGVVLSMRWEDIDFNLSRWRIPQTKTKNKDVNIVALPLRAMKILERRRRNMSLGISAFVFPGTGKCGHVADPKRAFQRVRKRMQIFNFTMHDLRRTFGSYMAMSGASLPLIGKALSHKSQVSTAIYARLSIAPVLSAVETSTRLMHSEK